MRAVRSLLAAMVVALSFVVLVPSVAYACDCVTGSVEKYVDQADVVVEGTVVDRQPPPPRPVMSSGDPATYTVTVDRVFKGQAHATTAVLSADAGMSCGLERIRLGRRYLVFANQSHGRLWATLCGGTGPAAPRFVNGVRAVTGPPTMPTADSSRLPRFTTDGMPDDTPRDRHIPVWPVVVGAAAIVALLLGTAAVALVVRANRGRE